MFKSPKTTVAGIGVILSALAGIAAAYSTGHLDGATISAAIGSILSGLMGIFARDNGVTSEQAGAK